MEQPIALQPAQQCVFFFAPSKDNCCAERTGAVENWVQKNNHTEDSPNRENRRKKDRRNETKAQADNKEIDSVALDMLEKNQKEKRRKFPVLIKLSNRQKMLMASVMSVLLYICFLGACVMTSVESVKSVIKASTTPVSSTSIKFQRHKYNAPAIILLYVANTTETSKNLRDYHCVCRYSNNGGLTDMFTSTILGIHNKPPKRRCQYVTDIITIEDFYRTAIQNNHSLINVRNERMNKSKKHEKHYVAFTIKGPEDWEMKEQVEIACTHRSHAPVHRTMDHQTQQMHKTSTKDHQTTMISGSKPYNPKTNLNKMLTEGTDELSDHKSKSVPERHKRNTDDSTVLDEADILQSFRNPTSRSRRSSQTSGIMHGTVSIEYMLLPSYETMFNHENRMHAILTHRGTKKTEFTESSLSKTLHIYLLMSEVDEQGKRKSLLDTEESYKIVPGGAGESGNVKLKFEWKSPMVWKIKTFIASSPWYAVTVICTMLLTLAEAVNVSRKIKILFMGGTITTAQVEVNSPILRSKRMGGGGRNSISSQGTGSVGKGQNGSAIKSEAAGGDDNLSSTGSSGTRDCLGQPSSSDRRRRPSYVEMMNTILS